MAGKGLNNRQKSIVGGFSLLAVTGLFCKLVGALFQIPLNNTIGPAGNGLYNMVFPTYNLLLSISSVGIPVAISRTVAHHLALDDPRNAKQVFKIALIMLAVLGALGTFSMIAAAEPLAEAAKTPKAASGYMAIAASVLFVCVMSAFRGFMQGRRNMMPTAISQLIEQVGKVFIALPFAVYGMRRGGYVMGAAGTLLGTSVAEGAAMIYMIIDYYFKKPAFARLAQAEVPLQPPRAVAADLIRVSIPITVGALIVPLGWQIDAFMLKPMMQRYMSELEAISAYGIYQGAVITLINVPTALAMAIATNVVPAISQALARRLPGQAARESSSALRLAAVVGLPSSIGMSLLAEPIFLLFFGRSGKFSPQHLQLGASLLTISSLTIVLFTMVQATSGILQGLQRQRIPMYTLALGVALKILLNYSLVRIPAINIQGAPYASLLCYTVSLIPNLYYVSKYTGMRLSLRKILWRPMLATAAMALAVWGMKALLGARLNHSWLLLFAVIALAVMAYFAAALYIGAVKRSDLPAFLRRRLH